jgi:mRNA-decapping enzyme 1B
MPQNAGDGGTARYTQSETIEDVRKKLRVTNLQQQDPHITDLICQAGYVGLYVMKMRGGGLPEWEKASIEGALFVVKRSVEPYYQIIIRNQLGTEDLVEVPTGDWDLDVHPNYLLYRLGDGTIRGWWFHDDDERKVILKEVSALVDELKNGRGEQAVPPSQPPAAPAPATDAQSASAALLNMLVGDTGASAAPPANYPRPGQAGDDAFSISKGRLRSTLVELVSSDRFLDDLIMRLRHA